MFVEATGAGVGDGAKGAYDAMAPVYDDFTAHHKNEFWLTQLLVLLERNGLSGRRLLDVGCGTGKSFVPMLSRGWEVAGCDISPSMVELAREKVDEAVRLTVADMRALPRFGEFDLVWALDDAINYMLSREELEQALVGMRDNLAPSGLLLFDANELLVYRTFFAETMVVERDGQRLVWRGKATADVAPGSICESRFEVEPSAGDDGAVGGRNEISIHRQRHFPKEEVLAALDRVGLECLNVYGHGADGVPRQPPGDPMDTKAIYVARRNT